MKEIFDFRKRSMKIALIILVGLMLMDIPVIYMTYKSNANKRQLCEQISEATYRIPDYVQYLKPIAIRKVAKGEVKDLKNPQDIQWIFSKFNKDDWNMFININLPVEERSEIMEIAKQYKLLD